MTKRFLLFSFLFLSLVPRFYAQHSSARIWNDVLLEAIRNDFARPTVHARNLHHTSILMYDAWAVYDTAAKPYFLGDTLGSFYTPFVGMPLPDTLHEERDTAISYAAYRLISWRFRNSPRIAATQHLADSIFTEVMRLDSSFHGTDYSTGNPAALGNYLAQSMIAFGLQDGSNEQNGYGNTHYAPVNPTLLPMVSGNPNIIDPNRWQPLTLNVYIDQSGNVFPISTPEFLSPEWGDVLPFALQDSQKTTYSRNGNDYHVYHDPGMPPMIDSTGGGLSSEYQWGFSMVATWSKHLDPTDSVMWDISPASIGNVPSYPTTIPGLRSFYDYLNGGDTGTGYALNPVTGQPYQPQIVPRGDYARVLAEFWADGPDSETPPGHWFTILNYVNDHPQLSRQWQGTGPLVDSLEWDVKGYMALGGAVHDAAISAWGIKGWYDYIRPISAIRYMADQGQCTDTTLSNYSPDGIPLVPGYIEVVQTGDPLQGGSGQNVGKIKINGWRGPDYISNPMNSVAGVGWILAEDWWPYQRPSFVTPPFAGYVSGHSTYSRAAAEVLTAMTGTPFFPGGMGEFVAHQNDFLVFEDGPSQDIHLQWATYRDASDQCSLSRIWGGIHPPVDDMPGRLIGEQIGVEAFAYAAQLYNCPKPTVVSVVPSSPVLADADIGPAGFQLDITFDKDMDTTQQPIVIFPAENPAPTLEIAGDSCEWINNRTFLLKCDAYDLDTVQHNIEVLIYGAKDLAGAYQTQWEGPTFSIDTKNPAPVSLTASTHTVADANTGTGGFSLIVSWNEAMDPGTIPQLSFPVENPTQNTLSLNSSGGSWLDSLRYSVTFDVADAEEVLLYVDVAVSGGKDLAGNDADSLTLPDLFHIEMENPTLTGLVASPNLITTADTGSSKFQLELEFSEPVNAGPAPVVSFPVEDPSLTLSPNSSTSGWTTPDRYSAWFDVSIYGDTLPAIDVEVSGVTDSVGNPMATTTEADQFDIEINGPLNRIEPDLLQGVQVYPNPAQGSLWIRADQQNLSGAQVQIFDLQGKRVNSRIEHLSDGRIKLDLKGLSRGSYLLELRQTDKAWRGLIQVHGN